MSRTRKLVYMALLTALALGIWTAEAQIPAPAPVPGVKLGLANVVTLAAMVLLGKKEAGAVLLARVLLGSLVAGSLSAALFSLAGGALAWGVMALCVGRFPQKRLWVVSALAALAHNAGQLAAAVAVTATPALWWYAFPLAAAGVVTGVFTGLACQLLLKAAGRFFPRP